MSGFLFPDNKSRFISGLGPPPATTRLSLKLTGHLQIISCTSHHSSQAEIISRLLREAFSDR